MKTVAVSFLLFVTLSLSAQSDSIKYHHKVATLDSILFNLYAVISGEKGEERDWDLFHYLFMDGASMIPSGQSKTGEYKVKYSTTDDYQEGSGKWLIENGFFEREINRSVQRFGNIAHVFSTYHCFHSKTDKEPFMRGINSIQLVYDNERWWVVNIFWAQESDDNPIPAEFLPAE